ncbi:MAG: hypothetical protein WA156_07635 [Methylocystis silviterrae]
MTDKATTTQVYRIAQRSQIAAGNRQAHVGLIVKTFAMQALADSASRDGSLKVRVLPSLETKARTGNPAMRSRGRRLVARLRDLDGQPPQQHWRKRPMDRPA